MHVKDYLECKFSRRNCSLLYFFYSIRFRFCSLLILHNLCIQNSREKSVEKNIYLFDIERVKLKKQVNMVHVRDQKHELTPPRDSKTLYRDLNSRRDTRCLYLRHPLCHPVEAEHRSSYIEVETLTVDSEAIID
ncbi:hypothetical protein GQ457_02G019750 [Hibiscus cannabinus]